MNTTIIDSQNVLIILPCMMSCGSDTKKKCCKKFKKKGKTNCKRCPKL